MGLCASSSKDQRSNPYSRNSPTGSDLLNAARNGEEDNLEALIDAGADVNIPDSDGNTPLFLAAMSCNEQCVQLLLKSGADVNLTNKRGANALIYAAKNKMLQSVEWLIEAGADVNIKTKCNPTPLLYAAERGHKEILKVLLEAGADVNATSTGCSPIIHIASVDNLIIAGADANVMNDEGGKRFGENNSQSSRRMSRLAYSIRS